MASAVSAQHTDRRAEIIRQRAQLTPKSGDNSKRGPKDKGQVKFVEETAERTGRSIASVYKDKRRGEKIAADVQKEIAGTTIEDSGVQLDALADATPEEQREAVKAVCLGHAKDVREILGKGAKGRVEELKGKSRRTSEEIDANNFDYSFQSILRTCSVVPVIDVPNLDSEQRSQYLARLQPAIEQLQNFKEAIQGSHEENEPARRQASRPARWADAASRAITALEELQELQSEYQEWLETLPDNFQESATAEKLGNVIEVDFDSAIETVSEAEDTDLPRGFGRDQ